MNETKLISEAREKGFKKNAWVQVLGQTELRKITKNTLKVCGDNILTTGISPFFIRFKGQWTAVVLRRGNPV